MHSFAPNWPGSTDCSSFVHMSSDRIHPEESGPVEELRTPSGFMRKLRPELYSDTVDRPLYVLDQSMLEFQLETMTARNEQQKFEIFCRKLCERVICPNIRPQSGPEGGGDGKTDADTFQVADAISDLTYIGDPGPGQEDWGFAFSAMKDWKRKVVKDVEGIAGTGRKYERVYFVTNQPARAQDRARIETELLAAHSIPVKILDRAWIVNEVIGKERKDIAHDYLGVGQVTTDPMRMGPEDYSRRRRLDDLERALADPANFGGMERQLVTEAMLAAQLSRNLELPRHETEGRHARAIRLAKRYGTARHHLEARHDALWTAFWWFDDAEAMSAGYGEIEAEALAADHARNIEFLVQLHQLLVNAVIYRMLTPAEADLSARSERLEAALEAMTLVEGRPNHVLEARTSFAVVRLGRFSAEGSLGRLPQIWSELGEILNQASGLAEFDADRLVRLIDVASMPAGRDPTYRAVAERLADFVAKRTSDAEGALILLRQALRLGDDERCERIRLLGRAAVRLAKREHSMQLVEAHQHLAIAYRGADLLWAARSSIIMAAAGLAAEGEEQSELPVGFVPTVKIWAWIALQLRLVPELLLTMRLLNMSLATLPLDDASKARVAEGIQELDAAFASNILNMADDEVRLLSRLPDALEAAVMPMSHIALLYTLGYEELLREDGGIPAEETAEGIEDFFAMLKAQPVSSQLFDHLILNPHSGQTLETCICGLTVEIVAPGDDTVIVLAQALVATFEAMLATMLEEEVGPHTERFRIDIVETDDVDPTVQTDPQAMRALIAWPRSLSAADFARQGDVGSFLMQVAGQTLAATFAPVGLQGAVERVFARGNAHDRVSSVLAALSGVQRISGQPVIRLGGEEATDFPMRCRPQVRDLELPAREPGRDVDDGMTAGPQEGRPKVERHRSLKVQSVIDMHSWDKAKWTGILYASYGEDVPPVFALVFSDAEAARRIFERWRKRFGTKDVNHDISISVIRRLPGHPPIRLCRPDHQPSAERRRMGVRHPLPDDEPRPCDDARRRRQPREVHRGAQCRRGLHPGAGRALRRRGRHHDRPRDPEAVHPRRDGGRCRQARHRVGRVGTGRKAGRRVTDHVAAYDAQAERLAAEYERRADYVAWRFKAAGP